jgi:glutamine synthetase
MIPLDDISARLQADFGLRAVVACEIEFTLHGAQPENEAHILGWLADSAGSLLHHAEKERGLAQFEVALLPTSAREAAVACAALKQRITHEAPSNGLRADFSAKPAPDQPGNGLHIHLHLEDAQGARVYYKKDETMSDALAFSIGGLLHALPASMAVFAPTQASYARFRTPGDHTPTTISWGANNRTCALRLPDAPPERKRIEHRVPGADSDPHAAIAVIVQAVHDGLAQRIIPPPQTYGDARLPVYGLAPLMAS